jgi:hypothetical protein
MNAENMPMNRRVHCSHVVEIKAPAERIFSLLCPVAEYDWIDGWDCRLVYTRRGENEDGCVFTEGIMGPVLVGSPVTSIWVTNRYDTEYHRIQFVIFTNDLAVVRYDVALTGKEGGLTRVDMNFEITAVDGKIGRLGDEEIRARLMTIVAFLSESLKHYCETGKKIKAA